MSEFDWKATNRLRVSAQVRHHSRYFSDDENSPGLRIGRGTSLDARAEYRVGRTVLFGQVRNYFDALNLLTLATTDAGEAEDPRTLAIGLESRF